MASVVSSAISTGTRSVLKMRERAKEDSRRAKLKRNIISLVVSRCVQGRIDIPHPTAAQLARLEDDVDARLDRGTVSDSDVCKMAASLRKLLLQGGLRSETAPPPSNDVGTPVEHMYVFTQQASAWVDTLYFENTIYPFSPALSEHRRNDSLPPIERGPSAGMNDAEESEPPTSTAWSPSTLLNTEKKVYHSTKPGVVRRKENLVSDQKWHEVIAEDVMKYAARAQTTQPPHSSSPPSSPHRYRTDQQRQKSAAKQKMADCRRSLDEQVRRNREFKDEVRSQERDFYRNEMDRRTRLADEEKRRQQRKRELLLKEKSLRDEQVAEERRSKQDRRQADLDEERSYRQRLRDEQQSEQEAERSKRQMNTEQYKQYMDFNKAELQHKQEERERDRARDKEMLRELSSLLEKQERSREDIVKRCEKKTPSSTYFLRLQAERDDKLKRDLARVDDEVRTMDERRHTQEHARQEQARLRKAEFIRVLGEQLEAKECERVQHKRAEEEFRRGVDQEVQEGIQHEVAVKKQQRARAKESLKDLDQQVAEKHRRNMGELKCSIAR